MKTNILLALIGVTLCVACGSKNEMLDKGIATTTQSDKARNIELVDSNGNCTEHYLEITETFLSDTQYTLDDKGLDKNTKYRSLKRLCDRHLTITKDIECLFTDDQTDTPGESSNAIQTTINKICADAVIINENI